VKAGPREKEGGFGLATMGRNGTLEVHMLIRLQHT